MRRFVESASWIAGILACVLAFWIWAREPSQKIPPTPPRPPAETPQPGRSASPGSPAPTQRAPEVPPTAKAPEVPPPTKKTGSYPVGADFAQMFATAHLFNIEIVDGQTLSLNFEIRWRFSPPAPEVFLDNPTDTTFLTDQRGRTQKLFRFSGISDTKPTVVPLDGSRRFSLTFPLPEDMESFTYHTSLLLKRPDYEIRLPIRGTKPIRIDDFR